MNSQPAELPTFVGIASTKVDVFAGCEFIRLNKQVFAFPRKESHIEWQATFLSSHRISYNEKTFRGAKNFALRVNLVPCFRLDFRFRPLCFAPCGGASQCRSF